MLEHPKLEQALLDNNLEMAIVKNQFGVYYLIMSPASDVAFIKINATCNMLVEDDDLLDSIAHEVGTFKDCLSAAINIYDAGHQLLGGSTYFTSFVSQVPHLKKKFQFVVGYGKEASDGITSGGILVARQATENGICRKRGSGPVDSVPRLLKLSDELSILSKEQTFYLDEIGDNEDLVIRRLTRPVIGKSLHFPLLTPDENLRELLNQCIDDVDSYPEIKEKRLGVDLGITTTCEILEKRSYIHIFFGPEMLAVLAGAPLDINEEPAFLYLENIGISRESVNLCIENKIPMSTLLQKKELLNIDLPPGFAE